MTWKDLVMDEINKLGKELKKEKEKMDRLRNNDSPGEFSSKIEILANMKSIQETINRFYILIGRSREVDE